MNKLLLMKLTKNQQQVFDALKDKGSTEFTTYRELAEVTGIKHPYTVQQTLNSLYTKGLVARDTANNFVITREVNIADDQDFDTMIPTAWFKELVSMIECLPDEHDGIKSFVRSGRYFL